MGPVRTGFVYGIVGAVIAVAVNLYFLVFDPASTEGWVLAVIAQYRTRLALAAFLFLGILAALRTQTVRPDPDATRQALLLRDGALAATVVAVVVGSTLFLTTAVQATLLADDMRSYAREAAPKIVVYVNETRDEIQQRRREEGQSEEEVNDVPPPAEVAAVEASLEPPALRDLGRSLANFVLRAILLGTFGGIVGLLRGRSKTSTNGNPRAG